MNVGQADIAKGRARAALACALLLGLCLMGLVMAAQTASAQTRPRPRPDLAPQAAPDAQNQPSAKHPKPRPAANAAPNAANAADPAPQQIGAVTKQALPRFVSLKGSEGNARRGPGPTHRIDWVFTTKGTPLMVTAEYENWRRVEDFEGFGGWVHFTLLSQSRSVLVTTDMAQFHKLPDAISPIAFQAERGVIARLLECQIDWCRVNADGQRGWAPKTALWGVKQGEVVQ